MKLNLDKFYRIAAILILVLEAVQIVFEGEKNRPWNWCFFRSYRIFVHSAHGLQRFIQAVNNTGRVAIRNAVVLAPPPVVFCCVSGNQKACSGE